MACFCVRSIKRETPKPIKTERACENGLELRSDAVVHAGQFLISSAVNLYALCVPLGNSETLSGSIENRVSRLWPYRSDPVIKISDKTLLSPMLSCQQRDVCNNLLRAFRMNNVCFTLAPSHAANNFRCFRMYNGLKC